MVFSVQCSGESTLRPNGDFEVKNIISQKHKRSINMLIAGMYNNVGVLVAVQGGLLKTMLSQRNSHVLNTSLDHVLELPIRRADHRLGGFVMLL